MLMAGMMGEVNWVQFRVREGRGLMMSIAALVRLKGAINTAFHTWLKAMA
jgi:hypothetical protein